MSSFYRFLTEQDDLDVAVTNLAAAVRRPTVDAQHSPTFGPTRAEAAALLEAADRARGPLRLRNSAILRMLLHNGLRLDELLGADLADLGRHPGRESVHDTLTIRRKGGRRARIALAPGTLGALQQYLQARGDRRGTTPQNLTGPLFTSARERRLTPKTIWELVRRTAPTRRDRDVWAVLTVVIALGHGQRAQRERTEAVETQLNALETRLGSVEGKLDDTGGRVRSIEDNLAEVEDLLIRALHR